MTPLIQLVTTAVLPIALLISAAHLIGAEDGPGDGFTAGIISALGLTLMYLAFGYREAHGRFRRLHFERILAGGLALATATALLPMAGGDQLLHAWSASIDLPILGELQLKHSLLFDLGVYFVVVGGSMAAIDSLSQEVR